MTRTRDRWLAFGGMMLVLALAGLIVATVLDAQSNGRRALERLQLAQVRQLAGTIDSAIASGFATEAGTVGIPPPWNLTPNDPADATRLARFQSPAATAGSLLIDRNGTITNADTRTSTFPGTLPLVWTYDLRITSHTALFGLAYKFDGAGPVVANY